MLTQFGPVTIDDGEFAMIIGETLERRGEARGDSHLSSLAQPSDPRPRRARIGRVNLRNHPGAVAEHEAGIAGLINSSPEGDGWIFRLTLDDAGELDALMDADADAKLTA